MGGAEEDQSSSVEGAPRRGNKRAAASTARSKPVTRASKRRKLQAQKEEDTQLIESLWSCPPQDVFDVLCARFSARDIVAMQLICRFWRDAVRQSVKAFSARRPDVDLDQITRIFPNITSLNLSSIDGLTLSQLAPLSKLTALSSLNLPTIEGPGGSSSTSAATSAPVNITTLTQLTQLEATSCPALRHELQHLTALTALKALALQWCAQSSDLSKLKALESLSLPCAYMEEADVRALAPATGLSLLRFKVNSRALGSTLAATSVLKNLQRLDMSVSSNSSTPSPWAPCSPPTGLTSLSLELFDTLFKYGLAPLSELPGLACLRLSLHWTQAPHCTVDLPTPPQLTSLHVSSGSHNSTQGQVVLKPMPKLHSLRLVLHHASFGTSLAVLQDSSSLGKLRLQDCHSARDPALATVAQLTSVTKLKLDHLQHVTPQGLRHLSKLASLHALVLSRCRLDDSVLSALAKLSTLRALTLTSPLQPTGRGAASAAQHFSSLGKLTGLQQLSMHRLEPLPERALLRALPKLTALRVLELQQQEGASDEVLCALTALTALSALTARFCRNVTGRSRTAVLQAFGPCLAIDYEGCRVPDPLRPLQQPSSSTQAVVHGRVPSKGAHKAQQPPSST